MDELPSPGTKGHEKTKNGQTGFEPVNYLEHQPLAIQDSQGDSQNLSDPMLARLVMAWPSLSEERKKIIGALLETI